MVNKVGELEREVRRMREDSDIWELLAEHRLPYGHEHRLRAIASSLEERTPYPEVMAALEAAGRPTLGESVAAAPRALRLVDLADDDWRVRYVGTSCTCLAQATELHALGTRASPEVRPLLLADTARLLLAFMVRSVTRWESVPAGIGVSVEIGKEGPSSATILMSPDGLAATAAIALSMLERPSAFAPAIPDLETFKEERWTLYPQETALSLQRHVRVSMRALVTHDFDADARSQTMKWMIEPFYGRYMATSVLLRDVVLVGAAAEIARRDPAAWREVLRGETTDLGLYVERAQSGLRDAVRTVAEVLASAERGEKCAYVATGYHYV